MKKWIIAVESMEKTLSEKSRRYLEFRRDAARLMKEADDPGRPGWVDYVQAKYATWFYNRYGIEFVPHKNSMIQWMNKMVDITVRIAIKNGAL